MLSLNCFQFESVHFGNKVKVIKVYLLLFSENNSNKKLISLWGDKKAKNRKFYQYLNSFIGWNQANEHLIFWPAELIRLDLSFSHFVSPSNLIVELTWSDFNSQLLITIRSKLFVNKLHSSYFNIHWLWLHRTSFAKQLNNSSVNIIMANHLYNTFSLVLIVCFMSSCLATILRDCGSDNGRLNSLTVPGCTFNDDEDKCVLVKGETASMTADFQTCKYLKLTLFYVKFIYKRLIRRN